MKFGMVVIACLMLLVTFSSALAVPEETENQGIPQRVALVEKVLEVEKLTKQPVLDLKGTDYQPDDNGKILAYVLEGTQPITNAHCLVNVVYPDNSPFIVNGAMSEIPNSAFAGMYYYDFVVPNTTGVYPVTAFCEYGTTTVNDYPDQQSGNLTEALISEGLVALSPDNDGIQEFEESALCVAQGGAIATCNHYWNITLPSGYDSGYLYDFRLWLRTHTDASEDFYYFLYNYNTSSYENVLNISNGDPIEPTTYQFILNSSYVSIDNKVSVMVEVEDFDNPQNLEIYDLYTSRTYNATFIQDMRGSNEIVVSQALYNQTINLDNLLEAEIEVVSSEQLGQFVLIVGFLILLFTGLVTASAVIGLAYSFIYLDGLLAIGGAVICAVMIYADRQRKKK
jgi:hypothetical protein